MIGIDCTEISRWRRLLRDLRSGPSAKLFTETEHRHCRASADPAARYAQLWCAKEAAYKALSPREAMDLRRIEIRFDAAGRARAAFPGRRARAGSALSLALARAGGLALAVAVLRR